MTDVCLRMLNRGDQIGSYRVRRRLGAGGMGEVYLAEHRNIDRLAAIKVLLPELSTDEEIVARFFTEARAASSIKHPGIVEIVDCEIDPRGRAYIAMEFLNGESLGASLDRGASFDLNSALGIVGQIAGALTAAHAKGIIHRDLKPDNIFLASTPEDETPLSVKILDFGIAKLVAGGEKRKTRTGSLLGTPLYMSPEQCRGAGQIDHRTDIYSLGCIAFELIAGRPPFVKDGPGELIAAHLAEPAPDLGTFQDIPPDLGQLVARMLAKSPDARPQTMRDVVHEIEKLLGTVAPQFLKVIQPPEGFPMLPVDDGEPLPPEPVRSSSRSSIESLAGNTRVLPDLTAEAPPKGTTFSQTASEVSRSRVSTPVRSSRAAWWVVGGATVAVLAGVGMIALRRPATTASQPSPRREDPVRPIEVAGPRPELIPPPPLPPPPPPPTPSNEIIGQAEDEGAAPAPVTKSRPKSGRPSRPPASHKPKAARPTTDDKPFTFIPD
jgi:serine/threonine protein kinase